MPTSVGVRYGPMAIWLEAFLGGLGANDFRRLAPARLPGHAQVTGICLGHALPRRHPSCPFEGLTFPTASPLRSITIASGAGLSSLLSIAYDVMSSA